jgi:serine/threonine-protein kinase
MTQNSWAGKSLSDRYQIEELLGQGGMSAVYKATDPNLRRVVAVKMIHPHLSDNEEFVKRFEEEAAAVAQLRHPNIIQVYDFNQYDGAYYMVLEFVPGETLQDRLKRIDAAGRQLPFDDAARFIIDICEAANYAHVRGMIHRDIKPANVMLDTQNKAILMDFGIAKIVGGQQHTATGAVIGTALYMAPEQIRGEKIDERVDVYAIGVTLFEMLHGQPPYEADSAMTLMMMHLNDPIPDLRELQPHAPDELIAVVEKALAKDRTQRYQSAAEMAAALQGVLDRTEGQVPAGAKTVAVADSHPDAATTKQAVEAAAVSGAAAVGAATTGGTAAASTVPVDAGGARESQVVPVAPAAGGAPPQSIGATAGVADAAPTDDAASTPPPQGTAPRRRNTPLLIGGAALLVLLLCVVVGGALAFSQFSGAGGENAAATQTAAALALLDEPTTEPTATSEPTATFTAAPPTTTPTPEDTPTPSLSPTATIPPGIPFVRINDVTLDSEGNYAVEYELFEFGEQLKLDGYHLTFFFDDTPSDQVGSPYETLYYMYAGESPFTKLYLGLRSDTAEQMCALVTKPDHTVEQGSGNCFPLPDLTEADALILDSPGAATPTPTSPAPPPTEKPEKKEKDSNY